MNIFLRRVAAALCFIAVALGAFGAHALRARLDATGLMNVWDKAVLYQFIHALALLAIAFHTAANRAVSLLFLAGIALFSGSLYAMCLTSIRALGAITPIGGLCFLAGWAWLIFAPQK